MLALGALMGPPLAGLVRADHSCAFIIQPKAGAAGSTFRIWNSYFLKRLTFWHDGEFVRVVEHSAIVFAAQAIFDRTEVTDLTVAFSTTMLGRPTGRWVSPEGFTVGFRGPETLWLVSVNVYGGVLGITELPVRGTLPSAWDS